MLLVKHSYREGWFLPGGRPARGESLARTARREAHEETGVVVEDPELFGVYSSLKEIVSDHVVVFVGADSPQTDGEIGRADPEIERVRWADPDELPDDTDTQTRSAIRDWRHESGKTYRVGKGD